ncbi:hypothetical protein ES705_41328 [subsurface metagenome]
MVCHLSVRDVQFHASETGVRIRAWTDVPAHLWVRLSRRKPRVHIIPAYRRGIQINDDLRFCFTVFEDNEQNEWGDTLEHTWWKEDWPFCTTKYLYFFGSVAGEMCVSTTAPFKYHNDGAAPEPPWGLIFHEPWTRTFPPGVEMEQIFREPWGKEPPVTEQKVFEPWTS